MKKNLIWSLYQANTLWMDIDGNLKNIETVNTEIKDGSTTIIKLFADPRK